MCRMTQPPCAQNFAPQPDQPLHLSARPLPLATGISYIERQIGVKSLGLRLHRLFHTLFGALALFRRAPFHHPINKAAKAHEDDEKPHGPKLEIFLIGVNVRTGSAFQLAPHVP
jgi:hypothetical protein